MATIDMFSKFQNDDDTYSMTKEQFESIIRGNEKVKKPQSAFFLYLNDNRKKIQEEYFSDFKDIDND